MSDVMLAYRHNGLAIIMDDGKITGIAAGVPFDADRFHVILIETDDKHSLRVLIDVFVQRFPDRIITAKRRGKYIEYNRTLKLLRGLYGRETRS